MKTPDGIADCWPVAVKAAILSGSYKNEVEIIVPTGAAQPTRWVPFFKAVCLLSMS